MFTHSKPIFGRNALRNISIIAIVAMLAGYFTFFDQVKPLSAQTAALSYNSVTLSDSTPGATVNFQWEFSPATNIDTSACNNLNGVCYRAEVIFPVDANNDALFAISTSTVQDIALTGDASFVMMNVTTTNWAANNNVADSIVYTWKGTASAMGYSKNITYSLTDGGLSVVTPTLINGLSATNTPLGITMHLYARDANGAWQSVAQGSANIILNDAQTLSATVNTTMSFAVSGVPVLTGVGNVLTDVTSTPTACPFGVLVPGTQVICAQQLDIATNAPNGYSVSIVQLNDMTNGAGDVIGQFRDNKPQAVGAAIAWIAPDASSGPGSLGHLGYSSDDTDVFQANDLYAGIPTIDSGGVSTIGEVISGITSTLGDTQYINYSVEISSVQPAGTYTNTVIYIVTANY